MQAICLKPLFIIPPEGNASQGQILWIQRSINCFCGSCLYTANLLLAQIIQRPPTSPQGFSPCGKHCVHVYVWWHNHVARRIWSFKFPIYLYSIHATQTGSILEQHFISSSSAHAMSYRQKKSSGCSSQVMYIRGVSMIKLLVVLRVPESEINTGSVVKLAAIIMQHLDTSSK